MYVSSPVSMKYVFKDGGLDYRIINRVHVRNNVASNPTSRNENSGRARDVTRRKAFTAPVGSSSARVFYPEPFDYVLRLT